MDDDDTSDDTDCSTTSGSETESDSGAGLDDLEIIKFSRELIEMVVLGEMKETAVDKSLKIFHALLKKAGHEETFRHVPRSFYLVDKWARKNSQPVYSVLLDICPTKDHYVFPAGSHETNCPKCGVARSSERQMMVGGAVDIVKHMFEVPALAKVTVVR